MSKQAIVKCAQCGSPLILVKQVTRVVEGARFPQTSSVYKCSNKECQSQREKDTEKRKKLQEERTKAQEDRIKQKAIDKKEKAAKFINDK